MSESDYEYLEEEEPNGVELSVTLQARSETSYGTVCQMIHSEDIVSFDRSDGTLRLPGSDELAAFVDRNRRYFTLWGMDERIVRLKLCVREMPGVLRVVAPDPAVDEIEIAHCYDLESVFASTRCLTVQGCRNLTRVDVCENVIDRLEVGYCYAMRGVWGAENARSLNIRAVSPCARIAGNAFTRLEHLYLGTPISHIPRVPTHVLQTTDFIPHLYRMTRKRMWAVREDERVNAHLVWRRWVGGVGTKLEHEDALTTLIEFL